MPSHEDLASLRSDMRELRAENGKHAGLIFAKLDDLADLFAKHDKEDAVRFATLDAKHKSWTPRGVAAVITAACVGVAGIVAAAVSVVH